VRSRCGGGPGTTPRVEVSTSPPARMHLLPPLTWMCCPRPSRSFAAPRFGDCGLDHGGEVLAERGISSRDVLQHRRDHLLMIRVVRRGLLGSSVRWCRMWCPQPGLDRTESRSAAVSLILSATCLPTADNTPVPQRLLAWPGRRCLPRVLPIVACPSEHALHTTVTPRDTGQCRHAARRRRARPGRRRHEAEEAGSSY